MTKFSVDFDKRNSSLRISSSCHSEEITACKVDIYQLCESIGKKKITSIGIYRRDNATEDDIVAMCEAVDLNSQIVDLYLVNTKIQCFTLNFL